MSTMLFIYNSYWMTQQNTNNFFNVRSDTKESVYEV